MKKLLLFILVLLLAAGVFLVVVKDWILKTAIEQAVTGLTGFKTTVQSLKFDLPSTLQIKGLEILNPPGFEEKVFTNMPEIYVSLALNELLQDKKLHLPEVRLNIQEVHIEKNTQGISNVQLLTSVGGQAPKTQTAPAKAPSEGKPPMPFLLDRLELTIRNVSYEDHSGLMAAAPIPGKNLSVDLNVQQEVFTHLTDPKVVISLILTKIFTSATFGKLLNFNPEQLLGENLTGALGSGKELLGKEAGLLTDQVGNVSAQATSFVNQSDTAKKAEGFVQETVGDAKNVLAGTTSTAKKEISGLFGKIKSLGTEEEKSQPQTQ